MVKKLVTAVVMAGVAAAAGLAWRRFLARWEPAAYEAQTPTAWQKNMDTATPN